MNEIKDITNQLIENKKSIRISRVPDRVKKAFIDYANKEFESDYGMCLMSIFNEAREYRTLKDKFMNGEFIIKIEVKK